MIRRLLKAISQHGVAATARLAGRWVVNNARPAHILQHTEVPLQAIRNPRHAKAWVLDRLAGDNSASRQSLPWIAWPCIDFIKSRVQPHHRVFEYGGGGSTMFFLNAGCYVTTVESSRWWADRLEVEVQKLGPAVRARWDLRFVPAENNDDPLIADYVAQVQSGGPWDVVMVDGWSRRKCFFEGAKHVSVGGILILDNADQQQYADVPSLMNNGCWAHHPRRGLGVARSWVTQTDAYVRIRP
jgi:hypothetical protein